MSMQFKGLALYLTNKSTVVKVHERMNARRLSKILSPALLAGEALGLLYCQALLSRHSLHRFLPYPGGPYQYTVQHHLGA
jgi:hypothetical protein